MNPLTFAEIINDLPDDIIEAAAKPQSRSVRWYQLSAIAAGIVLLIAAAVYPKLRMQTPPVIEPPVYTETATVTTTTVTETVMQTDTQTNTALLTVTATERTTVTQTETDAPPVTAQTDTPVTTMEQQDSPATAPQQQETDIPSASTATVAATSLVSVTTTKAVATQTAPVNTTTAIPCTTTAIPCTTTTIPCTTTAIPCTTTAAMGTYTTSRTPVDAPEPQTLTVPVWRDAWSPAVGYPEITVPAEAQYAVTVHDAQFMQEVWHWSPPDIQVFDYDYLRIGVSANAADAALLHAEYSGGELVVTVGLQAAVSDRFLSREFLLPVPKWLHIYGNQCSVKFEYTDFSSQPGMEQPQKIELNIS